MLSGLKWIVISVVKIKTCVVGLHSYFFKYATCVILCLINIQDKLILLYQQCLPISKCTSSSRLSASSRYWTQWSSRREPSTKRCSVPKSWSWHLQRKNSNICKQMFCILKIHNYWFICKYKNKQIRAKLHLPDLKPPSSLLLLSHMVSMYKKE